MIRKEDPMKRLPVYWGLILFCGLMGTANADIYSWVDADGIRHFSNHVPPKAAEAVEITLETPHVPPTAEEQLEAQKAEILAEAARKIAAMEAENMERLRSAERKIESAKQEAARAREEAEELRKTAEEKSRRVDKTVVYYGDFPSPPRKPFHKKKPVQLPSSIRKELQHMPYEGRINHPGQKPREIGKAGHTNKPQPNSMHRPGGLPPGAGMPPGFLLRVR